MSKITTTVSFRYDETLYCMHPDECAIATYLGRAEITIEKMTREDGGGEMIGVEFTDLWIGVDVPTNWNQDCFRRVNIPDQSQGFAKLRVELEQAAIDQHYRPNRICLPDEIEKPIDVSRLKAHTILGNNPMHSHS